MVDRPEHDAPDEGRRALCLGFLAIPFALPLLSGTPSAPPADMEALAAAHTFALSL